MALRTQPYLPLYVQDFLTDEKLAECSASTVGVYIRLMCLMHKNDPYGKILLKAKYKQNVKQIGEQNLYYSTCFALQVSKNLLFSEQIVCSALYELIEEGVLYLDGDAICQKRMVRDGEISLTRTEIGKLGGSNVTKQYGKPGYLYLMSDGYEKNKIGISVSPQNRLYRIRCDLKLPKHFQIRRQISVPDMGAAEDVAQAYFKDILNGEWLEDSYSNIDQRFVLLEANLQANALPNAESNAENEIENEYENKNKTYLSFKEEEKKENAPGEILTASGSMPGEDQIIVYKLPELKAQMVKELVSIVKQKIIEVPEVYRLFEAFKIQHFTGKKYYRDESDIHSHFINWAKTQNYDNAGTATTTGSNRTNGRADSGAGFNKKSGGFVRLADSLRDELTIPHAVGTAGFGDEI